MLIQIITSWTSEDCICVKQNLTTWFSHNSALCVQTPTWVRVPLLQFSLYSVWNYDSVAFWEFWTRFIGSNTKTIVVQMAKFLAMYGHPYDRFPKQKPWWMATFKSTVPMRDAKREKMSEVRGNGRCFGNNSSKHYNQS